MSQSVVDEIKAAHGKVAAVGTNNGTIVLGDERKSIRLFVDVPHPSRHPLIGRADVIAALRARVCSGSHAAISAVNGLPGVGKTAVAIALAHDPETLAHFRGGVLWTGLGPNGDANSALNRWGTALGVDLGAAPDARARARMLSLALQAKAEGEPVLLIVDDAWRWEHAGPFAEIVFPGCAHLFTTRDGVLAGRFADTAIQLGTLTDSDAETFLAERCPGAREADPEGLQELVRAVGGLPLGLTLIAEELRRNAGQAQWIRKVVARLGDTEARLSLEISEVRPGLEGVPNTLRAIIEMSVLALAAEEQNAFVALGAFAPKPADFGREAALAVWEAEEEERGDLLLHLLTSRGLVEIAGEGRFAVHQVLGAVAAARLGEERGPRERHTSYFRDLINADQEDWQRIERELDQTSAAWSWLCGRTDIAEEVLSYVDAIRIFHERRGLQEERLAWLTRGLEAARELERPSDEATLLNNIGGVHSDLGDKARALEFYEQALPLRRAVGNRSGEAVTLFNIAMIHDAAGRIEEAITLLERVVELDEAVQHSDLQSDREVLALLRAKREKSLAAPAPKPTTTPIRFPWLLVLSLAFLAAVGWLMLSK